MGLADFIRANHEAILVEWEAFARTLSASQGMSKETLRDHAEEILSRVVEDMETAQSPRERAEKSKGHKAVGDLGRAGRAHAIERAEVGFGLPQVIAEYRALRASVFRLWQKTGEDPAGVMRFNEAIDEVLSEAVDRYAQNLEQYRAQVTAIVSHELRNPLGSVLLAATQLSRARRLDEKDTTLADRIVNSAKRMSRMVADLMDLTRVRLGGGIPIERQASDLGAICAQAISELEQTHPNARMRFQSTGDLLGRWDSERLAQVVSNLVGNALQHGSVREPIDVVARGEREEVALAVHNSGSPIPEHLLPRIFEPLVRSGGDRAKNSTGLGLGLYIAREIVAAHGGTITVRSSEAEGTTFTVRLPRGEAVVQAGTPCSPAQSRGVSSSSTTTR